MNPKNLDECVELARKKEQFTFNNVFSILANRGHATYTIYSYGSHYPMYVYDYEACQWYGNKDKSTPTTNRHMKRFEPYSVAQWVDTETLSNISIYGIVETSAQRME
jgi:hypothetical protein